MVLQFYFFHQSFISVYEGSLLISTLIKISKIQNSIFTATVFYLFLPKLFVILFYCFTLSIAVIQFAYSKLNYCYTKRVKQYYIMLLKDLALFIELLIQKKCSALILTKVYVNLITFIKFCLIQAFTIFFSQDIFCISSRTLVWYFLTPFFQQPKMQLVLFAWKIYFNTAQLK